MGTEEKKKSPIENKKSSVWDVFKKEIDPEAEKNKVKLPMDKTTIPYIIGAIVFGILTLLPLCFEIIFYDPTAGEPETQTLVHANMECSMYQSLGQKHGIRKTITGQYTDGKVKSLTFNFIVLKTSAIYEDLYIDDVEDAELKRLLSIEDEHMKKEKLNAFSYQLDFDFVAHPYTDVEVLARYRKMLNIEVTLLKQDGYRCIVNSTEEVIEIES